MSGCKHNDLWPCPTCTKDRDQALIDKLREQVAKLEARNHELEAYYDGERKKLEARNAQLEESVRLAHATKQGERIAELQARNAELERELSDALAVSTIEAREADKARERAKGLEEALREVIKNERGGSIESITSMIAREALALPREPEGGESK